MERKDVQDLLAMIQGVYPNYKPADKAVTINAWTMALQEYDKDKVALAFKAYIQADTSGFAPAPGQLIDKIQMINAPEELNEMEAWSLVSKALRNGYYGAEQEFEQLPEMVKKAVGSSSNLRNWSQTDLSSVENVLMSNFVRSYRQVVERDREMRKLSESVRTRLVHTAGGMIEQHKT